MKFFTTMFGLALVLLALWTATGAVSLGSVTYPIGNGQEGQAAWLVYSPWVFLFSVILAGAGIAVIYSAAQDAVTTARVPERGSQASP